MINLFRYYYYRVFSYFENGSVIPFVQTFSVIIFFAFINLDTILDIVLLTCFKTKISYPAFKAGSISYLTPLIIVIPLWAIMWFYFKNLGNHDKIIATFRNETPNQKRFSSVMTISYFVLSLALLIAGLWLRQKSKGF